MPPIKKKSINSDDAKQLIQEYMKQQYRPYSVNDIQLNMHNIVTKAKLTGILDSLVAEGELICKTIGKANYYVYKQLTPDTDGSETNLATEFECLQNSEKHLNQEIEELKEKLHEVCTTPTNQELEELITTYTSQIVKLESELDQTRKKETISADPEIVSAFITRLKKIKKQRCDMFKNLIGMMSEMMEVNNVLELCGIDEEEFKKYG